MRFLLGRAGAGKTYRCLEDIRGALRQAPEGPPLILLAPKQATFQLERQLLADLELPGYVRLEILSFERLAEFVLARAHVPAPRLLNEEGRLMALRALLGRERDRLRLFRATARLPGFARQLSSLLRELQQHQFSPARLEQLRARLPPASALSDKLHDLAWVLRSYQAWLAAHRLEDAERLLDLAAQTLAHPTQVAPSLDANRLPLPDPCFGGVWLDGFAEMTPQEVGLLAALVPRCAEATLAFCLAAEPGQKDDWLSTWSSVSRTCRRVRDQLQAMPGVELSLEVLGRSEGRHRFTASPVLAHLEAHWDAPLAFVPTPPRPEVPGAAAPPPTPGEAAPDDLPVRLVNCADPEAEAVRAAREILRFVRDQRGRFRDTAVLVRSLDVYHAVLRRVFTRYGIPFFLDRRESAAHHPLAELTRYALRTVAFAWAREDWFGALKTGLSGADEEAVDRLENEALARGWSGKAWLGELSVADNPALGAWVEAQRRQLVLPFQALADGWAAEAGRPTGRRLAAGLRALWQRLQVERQLAAWAETDTPGAATHLTVWELMNQWVDNLELAFQDEPLSLVEWLPIVETGLSNLTVGAIPPALDQVLLGAIDRSRNPDLRLVVVLGLNESVFPASPPAGDLLTEAERETLAELGVELAPDRRARVGRERFYGYIACTRARHRLVLTCARRDLADQPLNLSPFVDRLQRLLPGLVIEAEPAQRDWTEAEHACELLAPYWRSQLSPRPSSAAAGSPWERLAGCVGLGSELPPPPHPAPAGRLAPFLAEALYGPALLHTSVSRLEQFAACPFKFFVASGLRAEERQRFEVDARRRGSFQHEVLSRFHAAVRAEGRQWRDLAPAEARARIARLAEEVAGQFGAGLFLADDQSAFTAQSLGVALQDFVETVIGWMQTAYQFEPAAVELPFGGQAGLLPAWELDLDGRHRMAFRGIIDRVDLAPDPATGGAFCVVVDYKSSSRLVDPLLLEHGIQLQLPAYLAVLRQVRDPRPVLGVERLVPAGVFYVNLRGKCERGAHRGEVLGPGAQGRRAAYQHRGRFDTRVLALLDRLAATGDRSGQFSYPVGGRPHKSYRDPMPSAAFSALLDHVEQLLRRLGRDIFQGITTVDPYLKGATELACDKCDFRSICRIDPWTHPYRRLRPAAATVADQAR